MPDYKQGKIYTVRCKTDDTLNKCWLYSLTKQKQYRQNKCWENFRISKRISKR